jgi:hypothetical protein
VLTSTPVRGGLLHHLEEVHKLLDEFNPDVLACSETWLVDDYDKAVIETDLYIFHSRQKPRQWPEDHNEIMNSTIEIRRKNSKPIVISCLYRHYSNTVQCVVIFDLAIPEVTMPEVEKPQIQMLCKGKIPCANSLMMLTTE